MHRHIVGLHVGRVLARSFTIWGRNLLPFSILALLVQAPLLAFVWWFPVRSIAGYFCYIGVALVAPYLLNLVTAGALAFGVFEQLRGEKVPFARCLAVGMTRLFRVVGVALTLVLIIGFLFALALFVAGIALYMTTAKGPPSPVGMLVLFAVFSIPAVAAVCMLWVAGPAAVVEQTGVWESLRRSGFITRGARLPIFGTILILGVIGIGAGIGVRAVVPEAPIVLPPEPTPEDPSIADLHRRQGEFLAAQVDSLRLEQVAGLILSAVLAGLSAVASVVVYYDLRSQKEQVDIRKIAEVFA
jgi:hypothetical protein